MFKSDRRKVIVVAYPILNVAYPILKAACYILNVVCPLLNFLDNCKFSLLILISEPYSMRSLEILQEQSAAKSMVATQVYVDFGLAHFR